MHMIRRAQICDAQTLGKLAVEMWTSHTPQELEKDFETLM